MSLSLDFLARIAALVDAGGDVMWAILLVSAILWSLIAERFLYLAFEHPRRVKDLSQAWQARRERSSWQAHRIREAMISAAKLELGKTTGIIRMLVGLCPLLGLLGTVLGMMDVFDVIRATGSNSARSTAAGVSNATITTMAGLVIAISGLYFCRRIELRVEAETRRLADLLRFD
jgi:biopolymer transport protein ExbB